MAKIQEALEKIMEIDGAIGTALVDWTSGMALGQAGGNGQFNLEVAAAGNTQVVRAKMQVMKNLNLTSKIEDMLITLDKQYHLIRPLQNAGNGKLFLYVAVNREQANLAMARYRLAEIENTLEV